MAPSGHACRTPLLRRLNVSSPSLPTHSHSSFPSSTAATSWCSTLSLLSSSTPSSLSSPSTNPSPTPPSSPSSPPILASSETFPSPRYVKFNTMQAIVLDMLLIFPDLLERGFNPRDGLGLDLILSLDSTVFLFLLVGLVYGSSSCLLGQIPKLPIVVEAADRQVL